ncbi:MAG: hypothetical protein ABUL47_05530, partial [Leifsonia sp.]
ALFDEVVFRKLLRPLVVGTSRASVDDSLARLRSAMARAQLDADLRGVVVPPSPGAGVDQDVRAKTIAEAVRGESGPDAVVLAQYSLAPVAVALGPMIDVPVLSGPALAGTALRAEWNKQPRPARS